MNKQALLFYPLLGVVLLVLFVGGLAYGAVPIPDGYFTGEGI